MGEKDDDIEMTNETITLRVRQYPEGHKGPYIVNIRTKKETVKSIAVKKIQKLVFDTYKHVERIDVSEHKMRVVFSENKKNENIVLTDGERLPLAKSAREEANELPKCQNLGNYRVYIPEKYVEVKGVISWSKSENLEGFCSRGEGKFSVAAAKEVKVLEAVRLKKKSEEAANTPVLENTGLVIVTFEGLALPDKFHLDGLLANVREFRAKQMFCKNCMKYNHTEKMCNNKKVTLPQNIMCIQCQSNDHESGSFKCPRRKILEKKSLQHDRQVRKKTMAEMLSEIDPNNTMPNESQNASLVNFPPLTGTSRKRSAENRRRERELQQVYGSSESPERKRRSPNENPNSAPPGFANPNAQKNFLADTIIDWIKSNVAKLQLPPFIQQLFDNFVLPFIYKFIENSTNSVMNGSVWGATPATN